MQYPKIRFIFNLFTLVVSFVAIFLFWDLSASVVAQGNGPNIELTQPEYGGIDLVFLVDQSGSMRINDPFEMRTNIIKWVLSDLGIDNLFTRKYADNRLGIVSFGTEARIDLPLVSLKTDSPEELKRLYSELSPKIVADNMGDTDVIKGFEMVKQVFDQAPPPKSDAPRTRAIILLTDGPPYREGWQKDPTFAYSNFYTPYFRELSKYISENFPLALENRSTDGYHIWVIGLNSTAETGGTPPPGASWPELEAYWQRVVNPAPGIDRVVLVPTRDQSAVPPIIIKMLDQIMVGGVCDPRLNREPARMGAQDKPACLVSEEFTIPPYISQAIFSIFKPGKASRIQFMDPNGNILSENAPNVTRTVESAQIERLIVNNPMPGVWRWKKIDSSPETVTVHFRPLFNMIELDNSLSSPNLFDTVALRFWLKNFEGDTVSEQPAYPIHAIAEVVFPDGTRQQFDLRSDAEGALISQQQIHLSQPGKYTIYVSATATGPNDENYVIFVNEALEMHVGTLVPALTEPAGNVPLFHNIPIAIKLTKPDGSAPGAASEGMIKIDAVLVLPDGSQHPLEFEQEGSSNVFVNKTPIISSQAGNYKVRVSGSLRLGEQKPIVLFQEQLAFVVDQLCPQFLAPSGDIPQDKPVKLQLQLNNCTGGAYEEDMDLPWIVNAVFQKPNGGEETLQLDAVGDGLYEKKFFPDVDGDWQVVVNGVVELPDGTKGSPLNNLSHKFFVYPTTLTAVQVLEPQQGEKQRIHPLPKIFLIPESIIGRPSATKIEVQVQDINGNPLSILDIADSPDKAIEVFLAKPGETGIGQPIALTVLSRDPSRAVAEIPGLTQTGAYTLSVALGDTKREYTPANDAPIQVTFERVDPLAIVTPISMGLELLILLIILGLVFRTVKVRINPVRGVLIFEDSNGKPLGEILLTPYKKNIFTIKEQDIRLHLDPKVSEVVRRLKIQNISSTLSSTEDEGAFDLDATPDAAIRIWGWDENNEEFISGEEFSHGYRNMLTAGIYAIYKRE